MTRSFTERERDVTLIADAVTSALKAALPGIVRREVEMQLGARAKEYSDPGERLGGRAAALEVASLRRKPAEGSVCRKTHADGLIGIGSSSSKKRV
jgi:hypothetical protein